MYAFQIKDYAEDAAIFIPALNAGLILTVAAVYHPDNLLRRGKVLVLLTTLLMFISTLGLMILLHPFFGALYLLAAYPVYAMYMGDAASRIIMAAILLMSAVVWAGIAMFSIAFIRFDAVSTGHTDFEFWAFYLATLLMPVGTFVSSILLFAAKSIREFQKAQRHTNA